MPNIGPPIAKHSFHKPRDGNNKPSPPAFPLLGTRHVVTFDGARNLQLAKLAVSCAGGASSCGCVDVTGEIAGSSRIGCGAAIYGVENSSTSAQFEHSDCLVQAAIGIETLREGGETAISGGGTAVFSSGGQYMLPSTVEAYVKVQSAAEVISGDWNAEFIGGVNVTSGGVLWAVGELHPSDELDGKLSSRFVTGSRRTGIGVGVHGRPLSLTR